MKKLVARFVSDQPGGMAIEYGLIVAGISLAIIAVLQGVGPKLASVLTAVQGGLN